MKTIKSVVAAIALTLPLAVQAANQAVTSPGSMGQGSMGQAGMDMNHGTMAQGAKSNMHSAGMSQGVIRKIDKSSGKITIKHGPLENLGMSGMTMAFKATDPSVLDRLKVGDKVNFVADKSNGELTVTKIEAVK